MLHVSMGLFRRVRGAQELYLKANIHMLKGQINQAVKSYNAALLEDPKVCKARRGLGIAYARLKRPPLAVKHYQGYIRCDPSAPDADAVRDLIRRFKDKGGG